MKLFLQLLCVLGAALTVTACSSDLQCSLNGVCTSSACVCDPGWIGTDCGQLDLRPANPSNGYNLSASNTSSWGIAIRQDPSNPKLFHAIISELTHNCGINYWKPYSRLVRAESTTGPQGPYTFAAEVAPPFGHNPTIVYSPADKLYLLYHIGCQATVHPLCKGMSANCTPGTGKGESSILIHTSPDLVNWTFSGDYMDSGGSKAWDSDTTNPSAWPLYTESNPSSAMILAYRGRSQGGCGACDERIGVTSAPKYDASYPHAQPAFPSSDADEDPFIWRDKRGNFHVLMHALISQSVGRHGYATEWDGTWTYGSTTAYTTEVKFTDGTTVNLNRRERPQLLLSTDGNLTPLYLTNGVTVQVPAYDPHTWSLVVPIGDGAAAFEKSLGFKR